MRNSVQTAAAASIFQFQEHIIRTIIRDGDPWFVASDICSALNYANPSKAVADHLDDDERSTITNSESRNGGGKLTIINESGLYALVLRSRKPEARKFAKWVTGEVLPAIRKTGSYHKQSNPSHMSITELLGRELGLTERVMLFRRHDTGDYYCRPITNDQCVMTPEQFLRAVTTPMDLLVPSELLFEFVQRATALLAARQKALAQQVNSYRGAMTGSKLLAAR